MTDATRKLVTIVFCSTLIAHASALFSPDSFRGSTPNLWYVNNLAHPLKSRYTVYGKLWREVNVIAIQYWFFYTYNDWKNDHEGDWEHINVLLTSQVPDLAGIDKVQYYFHNKWRNSETWDLIIENGTHVMVYIGGSYQPSLKREMLHEANGHLSNGSYPDHTLWENAGQKGEHDEVLGWGRRLNWYDITWSPDQPNMALALN